jgi:hypothetical protein
MSGRSHRILVTATTHTAVDQIVLAVDQALQVTEQATTRKKLKRFGSRVDPKPFIGREHLLPVQDKDAFEKLANLLIVEPRKSDLEEWAAWKQEVEAVRASLKATVREIFDQNMCVGMTATSAFFWFEALREAELDLVVVDEASQLGGPAARMIAVAANRILFAGDPNQLSTIVRTRKAGSRKILGATAFDIARAAPQVFLEEQSRMAPPICAVVSKVFYDGKLVVAKRGCDEKWLEERSPYWIHGRRLPQFYVHLTDACSTWSKKYNGPIRYDSAQEILNLLDDLLGCYTDPADVVVLTPFRAQRAMLRVMLEARQTKGIHVSTVHRAQGSERKIVIFDPVDGASKFLSGAEGDRLINVAISRAKAQVVVFISQSDQQNKTLRRIAILAGAGKNLDEGVGSATPTLKDFAHREDFPTCLLGQVIQIGSATGQVVGLEKGGEVIVIGCRDTGHHRKFRTKLALAMIGNLE